MVLLLNKRVFRRRPLHMIICFLVVYIGAIYLFSKRAWPSGEISELSVRFSHDVDYDFEKGVRNWQEEKTVASLSETLKPEMVQDEKMDWHDSDLIMSEKIRKGDGEQGEPVRVSAEEENAVPVKFRDIGYNVAASRKISLDRAGPDLRHPNCKSKTYRRILPQASFIIPFHNELNFTLLRTVHSIIRHSPAQLLKEIILVDDASTDVEVMQPLERYLNLTFHDKIVRILRIPAKQGLMNARSLGAAHAQGDVLIFFDAHIEVGINFLPPLLEPIAEDYKTITNPMVGAIDSKTFQIFGNMWYAGGVDTKMNYTYFNVNPKYVAKPTVPFPNAVMIGCAFAISKRWWDELEGYDPMLRMWGSEQFELSFKTWMCGGRQVNVPCSRIAHLFRPRREGDSTEDLVARENNLHRVALAWMDEYVDYVYIAYNRLLKINPGDVSPQIRLRRKLKCKSYDWFMRNVQPEMLQIEQLPKRPYIAWGKISSRQDNGRCVRIREDFGFPEFILTDCTWGDDGLMPEHFHYSLDGLLSTTVRKPRMCLAPGALQHKLGLFDCILTDQRLKWNYNSVTGRFTNLLSSMCMERDLFNTTVRLKTCNDGNLSQTWDLQFLDPNIKFY